MTLRFQFICATKIKKKAHFILTEQSMTSCANQLESHLYFLSMSHCVKYHQMNINLYIHSLRKHLVILHNPIISTSASFSLTGITGGVQENSENDQRSFWSNILLLFRNRGILQNHTNNYISNHYLSSFYVLNILSKSLLLTRTLQINNIILFFTVITLMCRICPEQDNRI